MRKRVAAFLLILASFLGTATAGAEEYSPSRDVFSPGMALFTACADGNEGISYEVRFAPTAMFSTNKIGFGVLKALFEEASVQGQSRKGEQSFSLRWQGDSLAQWHITQDAAGVRMESTLLPEVVQAQSERALYALWGGAMPGDDVAAMLSQVLGVSWQSGWENQTVTLSQKELDALFPQDGSLPKLTVSKPLEFVCEASESGMLTKMKIDGAVRVGDEAEAYVIDAVIKNTAAKLTVEADITKDKKNTTHIAVSTSYTNTKATKTDKAKYAMDARIKISGKKGGYAFSGTVTCRVRNTWAYDEESGAMDERVTRSISLKYTDKDPAMGNYNLGSIALETKETYKVTSIPEKKDAALTGDIDIDLKLGTYTMLTGTASVTAATKPEAASATGANEATPDEATQNKATPDEAEAPWQAESLTSAQRQAIDAHVEAAVIQMMQTVYPTLPAQVRETIQNGR